MKKKYFKSLATMLVNELKMQFGVEIPLNKITQNLVQHGIELKTLGVSFEVKRSCRQRFLILKYEHESDGSDGCILWVEITVPAVTPYRTNVLIMRNGDSDSYLQSDGTGIE